MRKVIQFQVMPPAGADGVSSLVTLCDDGTLWEFGADAEWVQLEGVPQDEPEAPEAGDDGADLDDL